MHACLYLLLTSQRLAVGSNFQSDEQSRFSVCVCSIRVTLRKAGSVLCLNGEGSLWINASYSQNTSRGLADHDRMLCHPCNSLLHVVHIIIFNRT